MVERESLFLVPSGATACFPHPRGALCASTESGGSAARAGAGKLRLIQGGLSESAEQAGGWGLTRPILFGGGQGNLYVYVGNDPVGFVDPEGKFGLAGVMAGAAAGGISSALSGGDSRDIASAMVGGATAGAFGPLGGSTMAGGMIGAFAGGFADNLLAGRGWPWIAWGTKSGAAGLGAGFAEAAAQRLLGPRGDLATAMGETVMGLGLGFETDSIIGGWMGADPHLDLPGMRDEHVCGGR